MLVCSLVTLVFASSAVAQDIQLYNPPSGLSWNEQMVLHSLRSIHSAQMTYRSNFGNGNNGSLQSLQQADLIDPVLATGLKDGYRFTMVLRFATPSMQAGYEITATPTAGRPRDFSFYMNEACDIRGSARRGRDATLSDPIFETCGTSLRTENEFYAASSLRTIHGGQMTYAATFGAGQYGTPVQLYNSNLVMSGFILANTWRGYTAAFTSTPNTATEPAHFTVSITPNQYGRTGVRSFFIDETGVLRGGDKNGLPALPSDPPVND